MNFVTYIIIGIIVLIFFSFNFYDTKYEPINYILRSLYHANTSHLVANSISLYALSFMEQAIGRTQFLFAILFIWILSSIILYIIHLLFPSRKIYTVGFSAVIFGLIVVYYFMMNNNAGITLAGLVISIIPQLFIRGISFEGHLSGIIAGFIYILLFPLLKR